MDISTAIKEYIAQNILYSEDGFQYPDDISFLEEGIVDSLGIMELVSFAEQKFKITILDEEITPENFDSVSKLTRFIRSKLN